MPREVITGGNATADGAGSALIVVAGPHRTATRWQLTSAVLTSTPVGDGTFPTARVYRSAINPANLMGTSRAADAVTFDASGDWLLPGDQLLVEIEQTSPGSVANFTLYGIEVP